MEIVKATPDFNFKTIALADPQPMHGSAGFYFTQLSIGKDKTLCLQLPECLTKQGMVAVKNGKYLDLMLERSQNDDLTHWVEQLEYACQDIIDAKKELWFQTELTRDDIETMMTQVTRLYQSGKYMLMRVFVEPSKSGGRCIAYDENEIGFDLDILEPNKPIIPLIMIEGVKFSSRSFEISLKLVQVMVIGKTEKRSSCLIKRNQIQPKETVELLAKETGAKDTGAKDTGAKDTGAKDTGAKDTGAKDTEAKDMEETKNEIKVLPIIQLSKPPKDIEEITIDYATTENNSTISLKNPNDVYYELYKKAKEKAKQCRTAAIEAYLEVKEIKTKYMLFDEEDSDDDISDDGQSEEEEEEEEN